MKNDTRTRPNHPCSGLDGSCGNTIYEPTYAWEGDAHDPKPIWRCCNCQRETSRVSHHRRTNRSRAFAEWGNLKTEWKSTDDALFMLVEAGKCASGALLVHGSTWNYHMRQLCEDETPSNHDIKYHTGHAKEALAQAKQFVADKSTEVPLTETPASPTMGTVEES